MPLNCDCYPGCWGKHSKNWPFIEFETEEEGRRLYVACSKERIVPYGGYVIDIERCQFRVETEELRQKLIAHIKNSPMKTANDVLAWYLKTNNLRNLK